VTRLFTAVLLVAQLACGDDPKRIDFDLRVGDGQCGGCTVAELDLGTGPVRAGLFLVGFDPATVVEGACHDFGVGEDVGFEGLVAGNIELGFDFDLPDSDFAFMLQAYALDRAPDEPCAPRSDMSALVVALSSVYTDPAQLPARVELELSCGTALTCTPP